MNFQPATLSEPRIGYLYELLHHSLWDEGAHKSSVTVFLDEVDLVMSKNRISIYNDELVDRLIEHYRSIGNKNSTINRKLAAFYKLLRKAERLEFIAKLPAYVRLPEKNARIRFLSTHEEAQFFDRLSRIDPAFGDLFLFLIDTGARIGEALSLTHADVHNGRATFWITKSGRSRTVPLTRRARQAVEGRTSVPGGPFKDIRYQKFLYAWNKIKKQIGLADDPQVVPHILRHTCASRLVQAGIDLRRVQAFLGHQTIQMTLRYAHLATDDLDQCVIALDRVNDDERAEAAPREDGGHAPRPRGRQPTTAGKTRAPA